MDDWLSYLVTLTLETLQRDVVPALLAGRAVSFTIHAAPNQPIKFDCAWHSRDHNWPPPQPQRKQ